MKHTAVIIFFMASNAVFAGCGGLGIESSNDGRTVNAKTAEKTQETVSANSMPSAQPNAANANDDSNKNTLSQTNQPKTVREFFELLPQKYFTLEGCSANPTAANCDKARREYLKTYLEVEDAANGYMKGGCDGAQSCFTMALFKRPNNTYIVGLTTAFEMGENSYFLEYVNGKWRDIGARVVPEYGVDKIYELPRYGTTIAVYENKKVPGEDFRERAGKMYDLIWKEGKFTIKR